MNIQSSGLALAPASRSTTESMMVVARRGWWATAYHALALIGIGAICALTFMFFRPDMADYIKALSPFSSDVMTAEQDGELSNLLAPPHAPEAASVAASNMPFAQAPQAQPAPPKMVPLLFNGNETKTGQASSQEQQWVTRWLAKRYRVAGDATHMLVSAAYSTANEIKLDPLLILAVMAIESRFNPFAESPVGAQGLMQVMSKIHREKFENLGGVKAALNPLANIRVGSLILKEYVKRGGSVEAGLKLYVGAAAFETDFGYGAKVLAEYRRLQDVAMGKKVSIFATTARAAPKRTTPKADLVIEAVAEPAAGDLPI